MKMRNDLGLSMWVLLSMAAASSAIAAPTACPATGSYQTLLNSDAGGGCTVNIGGGAFLTFSNFTLTPTGAGAPTAASVSYTLDDPGVGTNGSPIYGFELNPNLTVTGASTTPSAVNSVLLTYLIVPSGTSITSAHLLETATDTGAGVASVTENLMFCIASDPNNASGTCRTFGANPLLVSTAGSLTDVASFGAWTSMTVSETISVSSGAGGGTAAISQVRDSVDVTTPEPSTYSLFGVGLLALGYFARRRIA